MTAWLRVRAVHPPAGPRFSELARRCRRSRDGGRVGHQALLISSDEGRERRRQPTDPDPHHVTIAAGGPSPVLNPLQPDCKTPGLLASKREVMW